jgi:hypothetical protein
MKDAATWVMAKTRRRRFVPPVIRERDSLRGACGRQTRDECQKHSGDDRERRSNPEQAGVDLEIKGAD